MKCEHVWRNSSPEKVGHRRDFIAVAVLPGRVFVWLPKETNQYLRGKWASIPANIEAFREDRTWNREWPKRMNAICEGEHSGKPIRLPSRQKGQLSVDVWGNSGTLMGNHRLEPKRKWLSVNKETGEACPSMVVAWINCRKIVESPPMRWTGGGALVVVRERENRLHGEGVQDVSFWMTEGFNN